MEFFAGLLILGITGIIKAIYNSFAHPMNYHEFAPWVRDIYGNIYILGHHPMAKFWTWFFKEKMEYGDTNRVTIRDDISTLVHLFPVSSTNAIDSRSNLLINDGNGYTALNQEEKHMMLSVIPFEELQRKEAELIPKNW